MTAVEGHRWSRGIGARITMTTERAGFCFTTAIVLILAGGCSSIDRQWQAAGEQSTGIEGRWQGTWKSQQDGHTGKLLCVIRQAGPENYSCLFNATVAGIFRFTYEARLEGRKVGDRVYLTGDQDLGWPADSYHYAGSADPKGFYCAYHARDDHGYFAMSRPGGTPPTGPMPTSATRP